MMGKFARKTKDKIGHFLRHPWKLFLVLFAGYIVVVSLAGWITREWANVIYFATGAIVLWYTVETHGMRREMMATRLRLETPDVLVRLEPVASLGFFDVVVENASEASAFDIAFTRVPDLPLPPQNRRTTEIGFLKHGISYLAPRQVQRAFFLAYRDLTPEQQQGIIEFAYTFKDARGN